MCVCLVLIQVGEVLSCLTRWKQAEKVFGQVLALQKEQVRPNHYQMAQSKALCVSE